MRIASNKLIDCIRFYHAELSNIYDKNEIDAIFYLVADHFWNLIEQKFKQIYN